MKGYRNFLFVFAALFVVYILAELNRPKSVNWNVTLSKDDKNPYGAYIIYKRIKDLFPSTVLESYRTPAYNQVNNFTSVNNAYVIISPTFKPSKEDVNEMDKFVRKGNFVFLSATNIDKLLSQKLRFRTSSRMSLGVNDSTAVNLVNPRLKSETNYGFRKMTIDEYFSKIDTANTIVLGVNDADKANYIRINKGTGAWFVHAAPLCFSNYFMLFGNNAEYTSKSLSYLPQNIDRLFWDEFYKLGPSGSTTPLRFFLSNPYLLAALRLSLLGLILYVLFEMKRRQRIIPVISPLRNSTLDFVKTISGLYFQQKDNQGIARKKISFFLDFVRQRFFIATSLLDESFVQVLSQKSGVVQNEVEQLVALVREIEYDYSVNEASLMKLNAQIDNFYKQVK